MEVPFIYKYHPKCLNDIENDENLINLLKKLLIIDQLNILLLGEKGCGKSSIINTITNEYYNFDINKNDIMTINTLKEQGITFYRNDVKIFCQTRCSKYNKKKILILDDFDNINEQSQQVFRNFIDKYSHNVHFLTSCSNSQKVIDSIQSRMNIIKLDNMNNTYITNIIDKISKLENINISPEVNKFLLEISNYSIRIVINYLEKFKLINENITLNIALNVCSNIGMHILENYTKKCKYEKDLYESIKILYNLYDQGYSVMDILDSYFTYVKTSDTLSEIEKYKTIQIICKYIIMFNNIHEDEIELSLFTNNIINLFSE